MLRGETIILSHRETKVRENRQTVADISSQSDFPVSDGDDGALDVFAATFCGTAEMQPLTLFVPELPKS